jgi:hypothetical protein
MFQEKMLAHYSIEISQLGHENDFRTNVCNRIKRREESSAKSGHGMPLP